MKTINATLINIYHICKRELWLHANEVRMEHTSDTVTEGRLIQDTTYESRSDKYNQIEVSTDWQGIILTGKIDYFDHKNKVIHETKKSNKIESAHEWQLKFYIWLFELNGIIGATGRLEYPTLRSVSTVTLSDEDRRHLQGSVLDIVSIIHDDNCPTVINNKICKKCSYYDFCYA